MADATLKVFRGNKDGGQSVEFKVPVAPGMEICARRASLYSGAFGAGFGGALELQGREVRFLLCGGKWTAAADLQDAYGCVAAG